MASFDKNKWYQIYANNTKDGAFVGTQLYNNSTTGAIFYTYSGANTTKGDQRWQFYPVDSSSGASNTYIIRSSDSGPEGVLGTKFNATAPEGILCQMIRSNVSDESIYWSVEPWHDGTFYMTNRRNASGWHFAAKKSGGATYMDSNLTAPQDWQRLGFAPVRSIDDGRFSTVKVCLCGLGWVGHFWGIMTNMCMR
jgi:hypothetical protein